jgi:membrane protein implicated in regulation of membrane protease activity
MNKFVTPIVALAAVGFSEAAMAYVGPGAGLSLLGALWGLVLAMAAALAFVILWPLRRYRRRRAEARDAAGTATGEEELEPDRRRRAHRERRMEPELRSRRSAVDDPENPWLPQSGTDDERQAPAGRS